MNAKKSLLLLISLLSFAILSSCFYRIGHDEWMLLTGEEAAMLDLNMMPQKDYYRYANRKPHECQRKLRSRTANRVLATGG